MNMKLQIALLKIQKNFVIRCATDMHRFLIEEYGDKDSYCDAEIRAALIQHKYPTKKNFFSIVRANPVVPAAMFMSQDKMIAKFGEDYTVHDYLKLRHAIAKLLFGNNFGGESVSCNGFKLIYRAKQFSLEQAENERCD